MAGAAVILGGMVLGVVAAGEGTHHTLTDPGANAECMEWTEYCGTNTAVRHSRSPSYPIDIHNFRHSFHLCQSDHPWVLEYESYAREMHDGTNLTC